jgi:acetolactate synthase-1/2/3 large subunit
MSDKLNGAAAFFKILTANGVDTLFACPGTSEMQVVDEAGYSDLKVVTCIFENTVTGACDGYARMLDRPALGLVHVSCGLTNSLACLHNARKAGSRMILFGGGIHAAHEVNDPEHAMLMRQPDLAAAAAEWIYEAKTPHDLASAAVKAINAANEENGKIAFVFGPNNAVWGETTFSTDLKPGGSVKTRVSQSTIEDIAASLKAGKKTAFMLGGLALREEGLELAGRIAEGTGGGLYREWMVQRLDSGAGRVRVDLLSYESGEAQAVFSKYDQMVLVGEKIPASTFSYEASPFLKVPDGMPVKTLANRDSDVIGALNDLAQMLALPASTSNRYERVIPDAPAGPLTAGTVEQSIVAHMPENSILIDESMLEGFGLAANAASGAPHTYLSAVPGGAIGGGIPVAIGATTACPDRKAILVTGDWSMMQGCQALWTVANQNLDVCIVNLNNGGSASLESELARVRKSDAQPKSLDLVRLWKPEIDYAAMAESMGMPSSSATSAEGFHAQFEEAMNTKGPRFIDAKIVSARKMLVGAHMKRRGMA